MRRVSTVSEPQGLRVTSRPEILDGYLQVKVYFPSTKSERRRDSNAEIIVPKKVVGPRSRGQRGPATSTGEGPGARMLEAFREADVSEYPCLVRSSCFL